MASSLKSRNEQSSVELSGMEEPSYIKPTEQLVRRISEINKNIVKKFSFSVVEECALDTIAVFVRVKPNPTHYDVRFLKIDVYTFFT